MVSRMKKSLAVLLAVATVAGSSSTAFAASSSTTPTTPCEAASSVEAAASVTSSSVEVATVPTTSSAAGIKTTVAGAYLAKSVTGLAVTSSVADLKASLGLAANETPYLIAYDLTSKKNPASFAALDAAAASQNATVVAKFELDFAKRAGNKLTMLNGGKIPMLVGIKVADFVAGANYAVICVTPGGAVSVIPAAVVASGALGFEAVAGQAAYAVVRY